MEYEDICNIMREFDQSKSVYLEISTGETKLKLKKAGASVKYIPAGEICDGYAASDTTTEAVSRGQAADNAGNGQNGGDKNPQSAEKTVNAPLVGIFHAAESSDKEPYVTVGSRVSKGDTICMIEAMKMMSNVTAHEDCEITEVLVDDGDKVAYDMPLFRIREM